MSMQEEFERAQHKAMMGHQPTVDLLALLKWSQESGADDWRAQDIMANVCSTRRITDVAATQRMIAEGHYEACEHVEAGTTPHSLLCEDDSFGAVGRYVACEACAKKARDEERAVQYTCVDCKQPHTLAEGLILWRWYDFYAAQGDEPTPVCATCQTGPKHKQRVARDREAERAENRGYAPEDEDECDHYHRPRHY